MDVTTDDRDYTEKRVKVGVLLVGEKHDGGWTEAHYNGFQNAAREIPIDLIYREKINDRDPGVISCVDGLVKEGAEIIFATSFGYGDYLPQLTKRYPHVKFFHASGIAYSVNLAVYFGRIYQARYLTGIAAGMTTKTNSIGYVAAYPLPEVVRGINAFALGVRSVNKKAVVHVKWTDGWTNYAAAKKQSYSLVKDYNVDILAMHHDSTGPIDVAQEKHIYAIGYNLDRKKDYPQTFLTAPVWNWGPFYKARLLECFEGRFKGRSYMSSLDEGLVTISQLNTLVPLKAVNRIKYAQERLRSRTWDVFYGPIWDNKGQMRVGPGENLSDHHLFNEMDWFVAGVEGEIERK
ncbi:MAG: BMP family ABC transporter substrate-binding protein [Cloacibacillus sp.]